ALIAASAALIAASAATMAASVARAAMSVALASRAGRLSVLSIRDTAPSSSQSGLRPAKRAGAGVSERAANRDLHAFVGLGRPSRRRRPQRHQGHAGGAAEH